ncbi:hypothetical protein PAMP_019411 [Pampus punctatissimus]
MFLFVHVGATSDLSCAMEGKTAFLHDGQSTVLALYDHDHSECQSIDSTLSEIGLQQSESAGRYLKDVKFSNVFVSDMLRARQTAEMIMKHNSSCSHLQMACDPLLKEISFGIAEGRQVQDLKEMAKAAGQSFPGFTPPEGETQEQLHVRTFPVAVSVERKHKRHKAQFITGFYSVQVKERLKEFLEKMFQQIGSEHWLDRRKDECSLSATPEISPVEGKADDGVRAVPVHALVVTHGAYMCVAVHYFVEELHCSLPQGFDKAYMSSVGPNTGLCRFILTLKKEDDTFKLSGIHCVFLHRGDHVQM